MRKSIWRTLAVASSVAALAVGASIIGMAAAPTASASGSDAAPYDLTGCDSWIPGSWANYAIANCDSGGTGEFRAVAYCETSGGSLTVRYGSWISRPGTAFSYAFCEDSEHIVGDGIEYTSG